VFARAIRLGILSAAIVGVSVVSATSLASSALFTATGSTGPSTVTSGSVSLALGGTAATTLAVPAMAPGDSRYGVISVQNSGSLAARYSAHAAWSTANALTSALSISVRTIASTSAACDASLAWGTGDLATDASGAGASVALFGSSSAGQQTGDRALAASAAEVLCVRLSLPTSAGNSVADQTSSLSVVLDAEQTANNP
jgi:hypothetical protein